jgi:hypothetical protein
MLAYFDPLDCLGVSSETIPLKVGKAAGSPFSKTVTIYVFNGCTKPMGMTMIARLGDIKGRYAIKLKPYDYTRVNYSIPASFTGENLDWINGAKHYATNVQELDPATGEPKDDGFPDE